MRLPEHRGPHTFHVGTDPLDTLGRPLHDLRISVTDRCNFRCVYCMPKEVFGKDFQFLPRDRKSTRLNSSHGYISYAVFCLKKKKDIHNALNTLYKVDY